MPILHELTQLICDLVAIESVNPDLVSEGSGEGATAVFVASWLRSQGLDVEILETVAGRPSVIGVLRGTGGGRNLVLNAHMDTVGAGGMADAFKPRVESGCVYGRGAYDMKGSLAAIMVTVKEAKKLGLRGDLIVTAVADEEVASFGTSAVLKRIHADAGIVTEPTETRLCVAHKGFVWLEVETRGVAAHGSRPDIGVDAVARMGRILTGVVDRNTQLRRRRGHLLLGTGSIHASVIEGGKELSTYPDRCVAGIERRTIPGEDGASALEELNRVIENAQKKDPQLSATARILLERPPSEVPLDCELAVTLAKSAEAVLGKQDEPIGVGYWMDMALLNEAGIPTVAFGPSGAGAHADVEWVDVASVESCVDVYLDAAAQICAGNAGNG